MCFSFYGKCRIKLSIYIFFYYEVIDFIFNNAYGVKYKLRINDLVYRAFDLSTVHCG